VAASKFVAKLASEAAKPRAMLTGVVPGAGVVVVVPGQELEFLHPKPVEALWGVGPATAIKLHRLGVATIGDLARVPSDTLELALGTAGGRHLYDLAWGRDDRPVEPDRETKSVGHEETYAHDRDDPVELRREVVRMADAVATRLRAAGLSGRTVTLKVRFGDFETITRQQTLVSAVDTGPVMARVGVALLDQVDVTAGVRLLGVSVSNLAQGVARQLSLDLEPGADDRNNDDRNKQPAAPAWDEATRAVDQVRQRFGDQALGPAVLLGEAGLGIKRRGDTQWGPDPTEPS
jgi:DNA polymerase-4